MLNFEEFYKEQEWSLVELWGKLVYQPISAEEFAHRVAEHCYKHYNKGAKDALRDVETRSSYYQAKKVKCSDYFCLHDALEDVKEEIEVNSTDREGKDDDF